MTLPFSRCHYHAPERMLTAVASSPVKRQPEAVEVAVALAAEAVVEPAALVAVVALAAAVGAVVAAAENTQLIHAIIIKKIIKTRLVKKESGGGREK